MTSLAGIKRKLEEAGELGGEHAAPPSKRLHSNESTALVLAQPSASALTIPTAAGIAAHQGTGLEAPHMALSGHAGAVQCVKFAPDGRTLASAGRDRAVFLWHVYGETDNFMSISPANKSAVLDLEWSPAGDTLYTVGADKCGGVWDAATGAKVRTLAGHTKVINALGVAPKGAQLLVTGSDDASVKVWDGRTRAPVQSFSERFPVLAVAASSEGLVYSAGIDGVIRQWDTRRSAVALSLEGHTEPVTGLALSPDGNGSTLLSFGQDGALKAWDVRPFVGSGADRCLKTFRGATNNFEQHLLRPAWSPEGTVGGRVAVGSADKAVRVWDYETGELVTALGGHKGAALGVAFHPKEPILASCGADKTVFLSEYLNC